MAKILILNQYMGAASCKMTLSIIIICIAMRWGLCDFDVAQSCAFSLCKTSLVLEVEIWFRALVDWLGSGSQ